MMSLFSNGLRTSIADFRTAVQAAQSADGPKVGTVAVSPRGDLRMPSDACGRIWMDEVDKL